MIGWGINMFPQNNIMHPIHARVICIDEAPSHSLQGVLTRYKEYVVEDWLDGFVVLEGVRGEWHETRFVLVEGE